MKDLFKRFWPLTMSRAESCSETFNRRLDELLKMILHQEEKIGEALQAGEDLQSDVQKVLRTLEKACGEIQSPIAEMRQSHETTHRFLRKLLAASQGQASSAESETTHRFLRKLLAASQGQASSAESEATHRFLRKLLSAQDEYIQERRERDLVWEESRSKTESALADILMISERARRQGVLAESTAAEAVWAHVFANATDCSKWLTNCSFAPGRWAVGYAYLYVLYRALDETRPKRILDIGLGQSSKLIAQYAQANPEVEYIIVESDPKWVDFCRRSFQLPNNSKIVLMDCGLEAFGDVNGVRQFVGFADKLADFGKFDLVSIDAPYSADMKELSRVDFLRLADSHLADSFVIMMDDVNRKSVARAFELLAAKVLEMGRAAFSGTYHSSKDFSVLASADLKFVTSM